MNKKLLAKLFADRQTAVDSMNAMVALAEGEARDLTEDEQRDFDALTASVETLDARIERVEKLAKMEAESTTAVETETIDETVKEVASVTKPVPQVVIPATVRRGAILHNIVGERDGVSAEERAYRAGKWILACAGHKPSIQWCADRGIAPRWTATHEEGVNTTGGYLVPDEIDRDIIDLSNKYGIFRQKARVSQMASETKSRPRRTSGLTAYFVGESEAATESTKGWDNTTLTAKKLVVLSRISSELREDAIISVADDLVGEIGKAFAEKEDNCGFIGTGTGTYGGIVGTNQRLLDVNGVDDGGGLVLGAGTTMAAITLANLIKVISILPDYAESGAEWYCHKLFFHQVMSALLAAGGGNTIATLEGGPTGRQFLGYPVNYSNVFPNSDATSQILCIFGDLRLAADYGDRRATQIAFSEHASVGSESVFERDQIAVRGTERFDINVHDVGTASAAGPIVGLISAAS